jgi:HPt (histidine-containing phosphotransfer) domain-containing protein
VLVAATGYTDQAQYEAYKSAGFDAVLTRPLREAALRSRLMAFGFAVGEDTAQAAARHKEAEAMFLRELRGDVERLQEAVAGETFRDIARWSHRIKGAALMFGHECLGQMAARLEEAAGSGVSPSEMQALLLELETRARYLLDPQVPPGRS